MDNIIVISQNVKLESLSKLKEYITPNSETLVISTQLIFENEVELIDNILECKCKYLNFSDLLNDAESEQCDIDAFHPDSEQIDTPQYYQDIKILKNKRIIEKVSQEYKASNKIIVCDDLGLHLDSWLDAGYTKIDCEYYFERNNVNQVHAPVSKWRQKIKKFYLYKKLRTVRNVCKHVLSDKHLSVAYYGGRKYLFWGSLNRIAYRLSLSFKPANRLEYLREYIDRHINTQPHTIRLSTLHEGHNKWKDIKGLNVRLLQDGYLPPNYGSNYLYFYGKNTLFYTWDTMGQQTFEHFGLPSMVCPFRKKLYLPIPQFPKVIKKVLCVASSAGDWTAIKNRSDDDKLLQTFGKLAQLFPNVEFIYRCHPVWINPEYQGVNSINRAIQYIQSLGLQNIRLSSNIPNPNEEGGFRHSFSRSSFEEDLLSVDLVIGEHSISLIDAAFKNILFASVNVTGHRNFWCGISNLGFPHCENIDEIINVMLKVDSKDFQQSYLKAIENYNTMTDEE